MTARFRVELTVEPAVLEAVAPHLQAPHVRLEKDGDTIFLTSSTFDEMTSRDEVFAEAKRMVPWIKAAIRLAGISPTGQVAAHRVEEQTPDGPRSTTYAQVGLAAALTISALPPTILIDGKPPPPPPPIPVELALRDARAARALELFARDPNWYDLYKVLDVIEEDVGGEKSLEGKGWASAKELKRFTATANSLGALGLDARHARDAWKPPKSPMTLEDAVDLIRRVLNPWLATKSIDRASRLVADVPLSSELLRAAIATGRVFWGALAEDDDERVVGLLSADALGVLGLGPLESGQQIPRSVLGDPLRAPGPQVAARVREFVGYSANDCRRMGLFTQATVLGLDAIRLSYSMADEPRPVAAGELVEGRRIELILDEGRWLVDPIRAHDRHGIATVDLTPFFDG